MPEPGIRRFTFQSGDNLAQISGEIVETIPIGGAVDKMIAHEPDAHFLVDTIYCQAEEGVRVEIMDEHREDGRFALRITNEGTDEDAEYFDPYHLAHYGAATLVRITWTRSGWLMPASP